MPDNNAVKSKRDTTMERMKTRYPDRSFDDDEALFGQINDDYDEYDSKLSESRSREEAFSNMFTSNPKSARLMMEWKNGNDPVVSLIRIYGKEDILSAIEDPAKLDAIEVILKAQHYDADVEQAQMEGEVAGRNARIEEKLRKGKRGDGTVTLDGRSGQPTTGPKRDLGALDRYADNKSIFERGGEKRIARR